MPITASRAARAAIVLLAAAVPAQQTLVVDASGNGHFTDIQPAIDAAAPGDTILVRAGSYGSFALDKGLRVLGDPGVWLAGTRGATLAVHDLPLGQTAVVRGFAAWLGGLNVVVADCAGHVHVESVTGGTALASSSIVGSRNVTVTGAAFLAPGLRVERSVVALTRCRIEGVAGGNGTGAALTVADARVWFAEGTCRSSALPPLIPAPVPGIAATRSVLFVAGDAATVVATGTGTSTTPVPAIVSDASAVTVDMHVTLQSHAGAPLLAGTGALSIGRVPSIRAAQTSATQLDLRLHAPGALRGYALLSFVPPAPTPLGPLGDLWVELTNVLLDGGTVPANGVRTAAVALPPLPPGIPVMVQGLVVYGSGPQLSAPSPLTLGF